MANIKVSELTEATVFDDEDYTMIVQANQNKKITKENMFDSINDEIGDLTDLETSDISSLVNAINSLLPVILYDNDSNTSASVTLNDTSANYSRFIIEAKNDGGFYTSVVVDNPNGKIFNLITCEIISTPYVYSKWSKNQINGNVISLIDYCQVRLGTGTNSVSYNASTTQNYIVKVLAYK